MVQALKCPKRADFSDKARERKKSKSKTKSEVVAQEKIDQLVIDHTEYAARLAWSMLKRWRVALNPDEVKSAIGLALVEAAVRFDENKGANFKTFFFYHLRGVLLKEISSLIQEQRLLKQIPSEVMDHNHINEKLPYQLIENKTPEDILSKRQYSKKVWQMCEQLDDLEREVIVRHFIHDEPLKHIAESLGYCRCHISRVKSKALKVISKTLPQFFRRI